MKPSKAYTSPYNVGTTAKVICSPSPSRSAIIVGQPAGGRITLSPASDVTDGNGVVVQMGDPPLALRACDHGCLVQGTIYAIADAAGRTGAVIEIVEA